MKWITSQIGAREHFAIPRVLYASGKLERLYTDFWATAPWRLIGKLSGNSGLATRCHADLVGASVTGFNFHALKNFRQRFANPYDGFLQVGEAFGRDVVKALEAGSFFHSSAFSLQPSVSSHSCPPSITHHLSPMTKIFFGYDTGFLEPARWVKARGGKTIVCQMDPARYEVDLVMEEEKRWPGWAKRSVEVPEAYFQRREAEWTVADLVMVNSDWSKQGLIRQGVKEEKIVVVPLAYEVTQDEGRGTRDKGYGNAEKSSRRSTFDSRRPLRILFLGQVILRKGIQYLIEAARMLEEESVHFDVVGPIGIADEGVKSSPKNMTFHGPVSRDQTEEFYRTADLFVLPTVSDGFALTQLEAMAHRLPVIATPNCGEVVTDGVDGLIVPACDPMALAEAFQLLIQDPEKLRAMNEATKAKVQKFSLARLGENLTELEIRLLG